MKFPFFNVDAQIDTRLNIARAQVELDLKRRHYADACRAGDEAAKALKAIGVKRNAARLDVYAVADRMRGQAGIDKMQDECDAAIVEAAAARLSYETERDLRIALKLQAEAEAAA